MIDKLALTTLIEEYLKDTDCFLVSLTISSSNDIVVEIDSDTQVDIDTCCAINNLVEQHFNRDVEDYSLEVGSSGLTAPFKVLRQYRKNIGNEVELLSEGVKYTGILLEVGDEACVVQTRVKNKTTRKWESVCLTFSYTAIKQIKYNLKFN